MNRPMSIEASAADIESAIAKGISELGVSRDEVMVEVIEEPGRRLLGLGTRQAKVRLTVIRAPTTTAATLPTEPEPPATSAADEQPPRRPRRAEQPRASRARRQDRSERPARRPRTEPPPDEPEDVVMSFEDEEEDMAGGQVVVSADELAEEARIGAEVLRDILKHMEIEGSVTAQAARTDGNEPQHWTLEIHGRDLGVLIGRRGETLAALQYITRLVTSRKLGRRANLVVDVEGYKSRREAMLQRLAQRMAEQAVQRGRTVSMEPMPPHERRIIHLTLRDHPDVTTESVGEGDKRKVTVIPRRNK